MVAAFVLLRFGDSKRLSSAQSPSADVDTSCCAQAGDDVKALVARYSPVLMMATEDVQPIEVETFLNQPGRSGDKPGKCVTQVSPRPSSLKPDECPTSANLLAGGTARAQLSVIGGDINDPARYMALYKDLAAKYARVTYAEVKTAGGAVSIDYWFFYIFNDYTNNLGNHEGDWERIQVRIAAASIADALRVDASHDIAMLSVAYSRHRCDSNENMPTRTWDIIGHEGAHPVVYVADGSHANYFVQGEGNRQAATLVDGTCFLGSAGDLTPAEVRVAPSLVLIDCSARQPGWTSFAGGWGLEGPRGPCFHK